MTKTTRNLVALLLASSLLATPALAAGTHPDTGEALADDQTFTYTNLSESPSIDPGLVEDVDGSDIARDLFEGLMNQDEDGNLIPGVAEFFEASDDKKVYTFNLRRNAKWSNGDPVTAHDFVYAWQRAADPETASPYSWFLDLMSIENGGEVIAGDKPPTELGVSAIDDYTLQVRLTTALPYFPKMTTHTTTFPVHRASIEAHGSDWTRPENIVSNGAYVLTEHVPNERMVRERNPMYWNNDATILDKVVVLIINDENIALTRYMAGELDKTSVIPAGQYPRLSKSHPDEAVVFPKLCSYYYTINLTDTTNPALLVPEVRQALSLAVDRDIITEKVLAGGQFPAYTFTPEATAGFTVPDVPIATMSQADRDAKAAELLAAAGYGDGLDIKLIYNTHESHRKIAIAISQMWKQKLGVNVELANQEWKTFLETRGNQDYEIARAGWCGDYNEASTFLDLVDSGSGYNDAKYSNAEVDGMLASAKTMNDASDIYTKIEQIIARDVPIIPIYHYTGNFMLNASLKNWPVNNVEQNWYSRNLYKVAE